MKTFMDKKMTKNRFAELLEKAKTNILTAEEKLELLRYLNSSIKEVNKVLEGVLSGKKG